MGAIEKQSLAAIATWMVPVRETALPDRLQGIFFMDGNPLPDDCITFQNLDWNDKTYTLTIRVTAPLQWTFHPTFAGWILLRAAQVSRFSYRIIFEGAALERSQITPLLLGIPVPRWIVDATMCRAEGDANGDTWERKTKWFGGWLRVGEYTLRRIVDEQGNETPALAAMLTKVQPHCFVVSAE
jgi:hypothetical protein